MKSIPLGEQIRLFTDYLLRQMKVLATARPHLVKSIFSDREMSQKVKHLLLQGLPHRGTYRNSGSRNVTKQRETDVWRAVALVQWGNPCEQSTSDRLGVQLSHTELAQNSYVKGICSVDLSVLSGIHNCYLITSGLP